MAWLNRSYLSDCPYYHVFGRTSTNRSPLTLFWTGSGIEFNVCASELWMEFETDYEIFEEWISIYINGTRISRQMLGLGKQSVCIFRNMNPALTKNVKIIKEVQAMPDDEKAMLQIVSVMTDGEFLPLKEKSQKIEIIGDSITSGEGAIGAQGEMDWIPMYFSASNTYSNLIGNALDADLHIMSQSGWGVLCGYDNNPHHNLPSIYEKVCGAAMGPRNITLGAQDQNNFADWKPDTIIVNLGTNDGIAFDSPEWISTSTGEHFKLTRESDHSYSNESIAQFENAVIQFLYKLRLHNPSAFILWAYGMFNHDMSSYVQHAVSQYQETSKDLNVSFLELSECTPEQLGAREHPGTACHQKAAEQIISYLNSKK